MSSTSLLPSNFPEYSSLDLNLGKMLKQSLQRFSVLISDIYILIMNKSVSRVSFILGSFYILNAYVQSTLNFKRQPIINDL